MLGAPSTDRVLGTDFDANCKLTGFVGSAFIGGQ
jgi:hypothetical protein